MAQDHTSQISKQQVQRHWVAGRRMKSRGAHQEDEHEHADKPDVVEVRLDGVADLLLTLCGTQTATFEVSLTNLG